MRRAKSQLRILCLLLTCTLVATLTFATSPDAASAKPFLQNDKVERTLLEKAFANPDGRFDVIINTSASRNGVRHAQVAIEGVGARVQRSLPIIGGAATTLSGKEILALAKSSDALRVYEDLPLRTTAFSTSTVSTLAVMAPEVWNLGYTGMGIGVALLDSGVAPHPDLTKPNSRIVATVDIVGDGTVTGDPGGHGTHVAGIIAGNGFQSNGKYMGIAPQANIISVRVTDSTGTATYSSVIAGIQWVLQNKNKYNIRVMNISLGAPITRSYLDDPLVAAVEMAWFSGIVVVTTAGNGGPAAGTISTPGNDPFVITVGALDDMGTANRSDDKVADFSSRGPTAIDGVRKPDLVAPGRRIISLRSSGSYLDTLLPDRVVDDAYFRLSGTSMASPAVAGIAALLLQKDPYLTPNQVKYILMRTATSLHTSPNVAGAGSANALAAIESKSKGVANGGATPNRIFAQMIYPLLRGAPLVWRNPHYKGIDWNNYTWETLPWDNYTWENYTWEIIDWNSPNWSGQSWDTFISENLTTN